MINGVPMKIHMRVDRHTRAPAPPTEEEMVHRQLVRDVINCLDYYDVKHCITRGGRHFSEAHTAHCAEKPVFTAFTPGSGTIESKIVNILMEFKATEEKDTLRMRQIEARLAELRAVPHHT